MAKKLSRRMLSWNPIISSHMCHLMACLIHALARWASMCHSLRTVIQYLNIAPRLTSSSNKPNLWTSIYPICWLQTHRWPGTIRVAWLEWQCKAKRCGQSTRSACRNVSVWTRSLIAPSLTLWLSRLRIAVKIVASWFSSSEEDALARCQVKMVC